VQWFASGAIAATTSNHHHMQPLPFYKTRAWQNARRQALHDAQWQCTRCGTSLWLKGRAAHVHHRKPYLNAPGIGTEPLNLMALCRSCHDAEHHAMKRITIACDEHGYPTSKDHPWMKTK
jgi:hypothetical protein